MVMDERGQTANLYIQFGLHVGRSLRKGIFALLELIYALSCILGFIPHIGEKADDARNNNRQPHGECTIENRDGGA